MVGTGPTSKKVAAEVSRPGGGPRAGAGHPVRRPVAEIRRAGGEPAGRGGGPAARGAVTREAGYDGEYGTVRLFAPGELDAPAATLFDLPAPAAARPLPARPAPLPGARRPVGGSDICSNGDSTPTPEVTAAASRPGPAARRAGPGSARGRAGARPADDRGRARHRQDPHADLPDRLATGGQRDCRPAAAWPSPSPVAPPRRCAPAAPCRRSPTRSPPRRSRRRHGHLPQPGHHRQREHHPQRGRHYQRDASRPGATWLPSP